MARHVFTNQNPHNSQHASANQDSRSTIATPKIPSIPDAYQLKSDKSDMAVVILLIIAIVLIGLTSFLLVWSQWLNQGLNDFANQSARMALNDVLAPTQEEEPYYTLILGSDARPNDSISRSDVIMLVRIDASQGLVSLVSIPRDTMIELEGHGTQKINAAYAFDGPAGAVKAVSAFAGVPISHYVEVHFDALKDTVDALGGINVNVPQSFEAGNGGMALEAGEQVLNGEQALAFSRERYKVAGGDFARTQAQRIILMGIVKKVLATSPFQIPDTVQRLTALVTTDYTVDKLVSLALQFKEKGLTSYSALCPSYTFTQDGISYAAPLLDQWRPMMQRVDAGLDPNADAAAIPQSQATNARLGSAANCPKRNPEE